MRVRMARHNVEAGEAGKADEAGEAGALAEARAHSGVMNCAEPVTSLRFPMAQKMLVTVTKVAKPVSTKPPVTNAAASPILIHAIAIDARIRDARPKKPTENMRKRRLRKGDGVL